MQVEEVLALTPEVKAIWNDQFNLKYALENLLRPQIASKLVVSLHFSISP